MNELQQEIERKGMEIFTRMAGETPSAFSPRNLTGRLMDWSMQNEALKVQLFRLVDVLPALKSPEEVARHACDYLGESDGGLPWLARLGVGLAPAFPQLTAFAAKKGVAQIARTFIVARDGAKAIPALRAMREKPIAFTVDILGEVAVSERECDHYQQLYLELIENLAAQADSWPIVEQIDRDARGPIPRVNVSVKISALYSQIHPADPENALKHLRDRLVPLLLRAKELNVFINFDMENYQLKDLTLELFKHVLGEPLLKDYAHAGIAMQAYLRDTEADLMELIRWARERNRRITIRLIKGAYWDYETVMARQRGWPVPVFENKHETDANYERLARLMLESDDAIDCAFGTHSVRSIAACLAHAEALEQPLNGYEFQMLYGMAEPIKAALVKMGCRVREYCPVGEILPGMGYLVRRLLENTSNEGFLRATFSEQASPEELLRDPAEAALRKQAATFKENALESRGRSDNSVFENEPITDFSRAENRQKMREAIEQARRELGGEYPLIIGEQEISTGASLVSINPSKPVEVVGRVAKAGIEQADLAVATAQAAFLEWRYTPVEERARLLERAADLMRQERFRFAALEVLEAGKPWTESDADVVEAIDYCRFYASEMRRVASRRYVVPGETSLHHYLPRGIGVVIAPWNFPLAILCGMTAAALVTGNCVIMKPSEQTSVIAAWFMDILRRAGFPPGVANFLPGSGAEIGAWLVEHPLVDLIAFTGSMEVGLKIREAAGRVRPGQRQLKKVICEMGGKNALIIDSDADLDEAIPGILYSAFGYQGQKCSALSRLIVLEQNHDKLVRRLVEACRNLRTGPPEEPGTVVGPLIDREAFEKVQGYIDIGKQEAELAFQGETPAGTGYFVPPTIFTNVSPKSRIAQEEIFGPVLAVIKARDLDKAISIANDSPYGLTGGVYSRSPASIEKVTRELQAGNVYINRGITGAIVARHPFGGFKMSGGGTKAGGRDYLQHFMFPRTITENRMRHGFAPEE